jgi:GNAT superfamily N-acetyltransferase
MDIYTRQMSSEDAAVVATLSRQLGYPLSSQQILQNINAVSRSTDHNAFVAIYDSHVVGWIGLAQAIMIESLPFCEINGLVIDENHRGKGVGKLLVEKAKQWAKEKGNDTLRLRCNVKRTGAHEFYRHLGFREIKQQTAFILDLAQ